jgi:hypothetical protein
MVANMTAIKIAYNRHFEGGIFRKALMVFVGWMIAAFNLIGKAFHQRRSLYGSIKGCS